MIPSKAQLQRCTAQAWGYALWHYVMDEFQELPLNYELVLEGEVLQLFLQNGVNLSFLVASEKPAPETLELSPKTPKNNQAWLFLTDFYAQNGLSLDSALQKTTLCLCVYSEKMAMGFRLAQNLKSNWPLIMVLESNAVFPFQIKPAKFMLQSWPALAANAIGASPLLEDWGIPNRLCSPMGIPGCFEGSLAELETIWTPPSHWQVIRVC